MAVPFGAIDDVVKAAGDVFAGKTVVDATNALDANMNLAVGFTTSGAEELQKKLPKSRVVKAFNTVFAQHMESGKLGDQRLTAFVASDDEPARKQVVELARQHRLRSRRLRTAEERATARAARIFQHPARVRARHGHTDRLQAAAWESCIMSDQTAKPQTGSELREAVVHGSAKGFAQEITVAATAWS